jgi:arsenate reductase
MNKILFLCPHHAAKSVMAAAYFNRLIQDYDLPFVADSAGTEPDEHINPAVADLLRAEGFDVSNHQPRRVEEDELNESARIISMGCTAEELGISPERVEGWSDVPIVSQDLPGARAAILRHVEGLIGELAQQYLTP